MPPPPTTVGGAVNIGKLKALIKNHDKRIIIKFGNGDDNGNDGNDSSKFILTIIKVKNRQLRRNTAKHVKIRILSVFIIKLIY